MADLPSVTFILKRSIKGETEESDVATMTIEGSGLERSECEWALCIFLRTYRRKQHLQAALTGENVPEGRSLLPRFDAKGRLYTIH